MRLRLVLAAVALFGSAETALAQFNIQWKYTCAPGRFRISYSSKNPKSWHYCYDGNYYNEKTLPADLRAYFNKVDQDMKEAMDKFHKDWDESKQRSTEYWAKVDADRAARGLPTLASQREANLRWAAERHGRNVPGTTAGAGNRTMLLRSSPGPGGGVEASAKPEAEPVALEALKAVAPGTSAADLVATLGEPPGKVATGEGVESWTYVLTTGAFAKVKMEAGAVKAVVLPD